MQLGTVEKRTPIETRVMMMFRISPTHMRGFEKAQKELFVDLVVQDLRNRFEDAAALPIHELRAGVIVQVARAEEYGLFLEKEQAIYATSAWLLGEDFNIQHPAAQEVLNSKRFTSKEKTEWLKLFALEVFKRLGHK